MELFARGTQNYACRAVAGGDAGAFAWSAAVPDAELFAGGPDCGPDGGLVGRHFAGPTWEWTADQSSFVGDKASAVAVPAPDRASVPWLLLHRKSGSGAGRLGAIKLVERLDTVGGLVTQQDAGCTAAAADAGLVVKVPYRATYVFFETN
jgi:hypothetical protein